ncbi:hypothetical protein KM043_006166 [Ampulex compressa]|nr:hypothetical protein KM043_006166 [Ampulex compressa]
MERGTEKVVLVTGASSGIGKALAEQLVCKGFKVVGVARRVEKIKALADQLKSQPGKLYPLRCDLSDQNEILRTLEWIEKNLGCIDILVNNAAVDLDASCQSGDQEDWQKTYNVNVLGLTAITKEVLKLMKKKGIDNGCIVNIGDTCAYKAPATCERPVSSAYITSKCALISLTSCLRSELAQFESNIKVTCISTGLVETEMTQQWLKENPRPALKPQEVCDAILFVLQTPENVLVKDLVISPLRECV